MKMPCAATKVSDKFVYGGCCAILTAHFELRPSTENILEVKLQRVHVVSEGSGPPSSMLERGRHLSPPEDLLALQH